MPEHQMSYDPLEYHRAFQARVETSQLEEALLARAGISDEHRRILDIGCGDATHARFLTERFPHIEYVIGLDISAAALSLAAGNGEKLKLQLADMNSIPTRDSVFDFVYARYAIHYSTSLYETLAELARVTKTRGILYFEDAHPISGLMLKPSRDYGSREDVRFPVNCGAAMSTIHPSFTTEDYIRAIIESGWDILDIRERFGRRATAREFQPFRIPTILAFRLIKK